MRLLPPPPRPYRPRSAHLEPPGASFFWPSRITDKVARADRANGFEDRATPCGTAEVHDYKALCQVQVVEDNPEGTDGSRVINNGDVGGECRAIPGPILVKGMGGPMG